MTQFDDYVTVTDAAERLGIHPESVRRLIRLERLPAKKFANSWLIARDVLEQFAAGYDRRPGNKATLFSIRDKANKLSKQDSSKSKSKLNGG
ncbi:MAG: helix-turn-helix domain-containing protein [Chloroflexota bacterium]